MIKSGTLRRKFNESIDKKTLCKNALLLGIAYFDKQDNSKYRDDLSKVFLKYEKNGKQEIIDTIKSITDEYLLSYQQADTFYKFVSDKKYNMYQNNFIPDKLLRFTDNASQNKKMLKSAELKDYIWQNQLVSFVLENIGCKHIHEYNNYIRCSNADGNNVNAITVFTDNCLLNVINDTRVMKNNKNIGDIITLVSYTKGLKYFDSIKYLHSILGLYDIDIDKLNYNAAEIEKINDEIDREQQKKRKEEYQKALARDIKQYNNGINANPIEWLQEGIIYQDKFDIRISNDNSQILIPIKNIDGEIVGINKRTRKTAAEIELLGIPKYSLTSGFNKNDCIYGLYENINNITSKGYAVIFEGVKSVLQRSTMQDNTGIAIMGHWLSDKQAITIASLNLNEVVIAFDKDIEKEETEYYCDKLIKYGVKKVSYIYDVDNLLDDKDSPTDKGNAIYQQLFDNRVIVNLF